jgi:hypothetical protein
MAQADLMQAMQQAMWVRSDDIPSGYDEVGTVFYMGMKIGIHKSIYFKDEYVKTSDWYDSLWSEKGKKKS